MSASRNVIVVDPIRVPRGPDRPRAGRRHRSRRPVTCSHSGPTSPSQRAQSPAPARQQDLRSLIMEALDPSPPSRPPRLRAHATLNGKSHTTRAVPQKSTAVGHRRGVMSWPGASAVVLNHPLAEPVRGFCKQGVRGLNPLSCTAGQRPFPLARKGLCRVCFRAT